MTSTAINQNPSLEDRLEKGVLNLWYLVADVETITSEPIGLKRLDQHVVIWRDEFGEIHVVEDRCPHRGARLSKGRVLGGHITCTYHGIRINGEGVIVDLSLIHI